MLLKTSIEDEQFTHSNFDTSKDNVINASIFSNFFFDKNNFFTVLSSKGLLRKGLYVLVD